jgi:hypothetical protein
VVTIAPSLLLARENPQLNIEAKKRQAKSGCRCSHVFSGSTDDTTGIEELQTFSEHTPDWATALVVVSFNRRAPVVMRPEALLVWLADAVDADFDTPDVLLTEREQRLCKALEPRLTASGNVSMVKPETDVLKSASQVPSEGACVIGQHPTFSSTDVEVLVDGD